MPQITPVLHIPACLRGIRGVFGLVLLKGKLVPEIQNSTFTCIKSTTIKNKLKFHRGSVFNICMMEMKDFLF